MPYEDTEAVREWIVWAKGYADRIDPLILGHPMLAYGRFQNPLTQYDARAGEPSRRWEGRWNKWEGHPKRTSDPDRLSLGSRIDFRQ